MPLVKSAWGSILLALVLAPWASGAAQKLNAKTAPQRFLAVYRLDGSRQCQTAKTISIDEMAQQLKSEDATVLHAETRQLPLAFPAECGAPVGKANYFEVSVSDLAAFHKQRGKPTAFNPWPFETPTRVVSFYDGAVSCQKGGFAIDSSLKMLRSIGIEPLGQVVQRIENVPPGCQRPSGYFHIFRIAATEVPAALKAGFVERASRSPESCHGVVAPEEGTAAHDLLTLPLQRVLNLPEYKYVFEVGHRILRFEMVVRSDGTATDVTVGVEAVVPPAPRFATGLQSEAEPVPPLSEAAKRAFADAAKKSFFQPAVFDGCYVSIRAAVKLNISR